MANRLIQEFVRVRQHREEDRPSLLIALCSRTFQNRVIIFFRSKAAAHHMKIIFSLLGLKSSELHGDLTQEQVKSCFFCCFFFFWGFICFIFDFLKRL